MGKDQINLTEIEKHPFFSTFRMVAAGSNTDRKRSYDLELCPKFYNTIKEDIEIAAESGHDNRNIKDDGQSQQLTSDDIDTLRDTGKTSTEIVTEIVVNSKSFANKTEFSQEKYIRKKEKKYFEYIQIRQPTVRLIADIYFRQDAEKIMGIRIDMLSQILTYSNVSSGSRCLLYDSGTNGLVPASLLSRIGSADDDASHLLYLHPGNFPQKQAVQALNLGIDGERNFKSANLYSALRTFYQDPEEMEPALKKAKMEENDVPKKRWEVDNEAAAKMLTNKFDSLVIVAKEDPVNLLKALLPFVKPSRPFVVYSQHRELLFDCYVEIKGSAAIPATDLHIVSNFMRNYQVQQDRTHPEINMSGNGGYILLGTTVK